MAQVLTAARIRSLRPKGRSYEVTCSRLPGFVVRVLPSGKKVFFARRRVDGRDARVRLGVLSDTFSLVQARREAAHVLAGASLYTSRSDASQERPRAHSRGRSRVKGQRSSEHLEEGPKVAPQLSVRALSERFLREYVDVYLKPSTRKIYRDMLNRLILPRFGDRAFESIRRSDAKALHGDLSESRGVADYAVCVLGSLYTRIIEDWELSEMRHPCAGIKRFGSRRVERFLSPEERRRVEAVITRGLRLRPGNRGRIAPYSAWAIRLLMLTGLRKSEVLGLEWPMVDWQHSCFHLPETKRGQRTVLVSHEVMVLLREVQAAYRNPVVGLVIRGRNGTKLTSLNYTWNSIRQAAGIPDVRIHDLRHSFASDALMAGVPLAIVGEMLGHRNPSTTQRYAHLADSVVREALVTATRRIVGTKAVEEESTRRIPKSVQDQPRPFLCLDDTEWARVAPLVEANRPRPGPPVDLRGVVDAIRWVESQEDARWSDLPRELGRPTTCWRWHKRWQERGVWAKVVAVLSEAHL